MAVAKYDIMSVVGKSGLCFILNARLLTEQNLANFSEWSSLFSVGPSLNMPTKQWLFEELDLISLRIWDTSLDNSAFTALKQKVSELSAQIAVYYVFNNTASQLVQEVTSAFSFIQS